MAELAADALGGLSVSMVTVDPGYVAGEETAAVRAINGGPAKPTDKPPRPPGERTEAEASAAFFINLISCVCQPAVTARQRAKRERVPVGDR